MVLIILTMAINVNAVNIDISTLKHYYTIDDGIGTNVSDSYGTYDGVLDTNTGRTPTWSSNAFLGTSSLYADGTNDVKNFKITNVDDDFNSSYTINFWVNITEQSATQRFLEGVNTNNAGITMYVTTLDVLVFRHGDGSVKSTSNYMYNAHYGNWAMITQTWDGTQFCGYVNAVLHDCVNTNTYSKTASHAFMARNSDAGQGIRDGYLDEMAVFSDAKNLSEIQYLYNSGTGVTYTQLISNDAIAPSITINSPIATVYSDSVVLFNFTVTDVGGVDTITYTYNGTNVTYTTPLTINLSNDNYVLYVWANDTSNNTAMEMINFSVNDVSNTDDTGGDTGGTGTTTLNNTVNINTEELNNTFMLFLYLLIITIIGVFAYANNNEILKVLLGVITGYVAILLVSVYSLPYFGIFAMLLAIAFVLDGINT
jgi:hypothetical protein